MVEFRLRITVYMEQSLVIASIGKLNFRRGNPVDRISEPRGNPNDRIYKARYRGILLGGICKNKELDAKCWFQKHQELISAIVRDIHILLAYDSWRACQVLYSACLWCAMPFG